MVRRHCVKEVAAQEFAGLVAVSLEPKQLRTSSTRLHTYLAEGSKRKDRENLRWLRKEFCFLFR